MESYHKMDIESLERKMKEHTQIIRDIYLITTLILIFTLFISVYLIFDKYYNTSYQPSVPIVDFYV